MSQPTKNEQDSETTGDSGTCVETGVAGGYTRTGIALMLLSGVLWFSLFAIPFLPLTTGNKALLAAATFVGVQVTWWLGAALAGPRVIRKVKGWLRRNK